MISYFWTLDSPKIVRYGITGSSGQICGTNTFQFDVVIKEYVEWNNKPPNLFDIVFYSLDLEQTNTWIVDSGATKHVTRSRKVFDSLESGNRSSAMQTNSNHILLKESTGSISLSIDREIHMMNVLYIHGYTSDLVSIKCITNKGCIVVFDKLQCLI